MYSDEQNVENIASGGILDLYAVWSPNSYTLTYNSNGGNETSVSETFTYDAVRNLRVNDFTKTGYHLSRWNTEADGSGISYSDSASVSNLTPVNGGTVNLYAIWEANKYTVRFNANGGTGEMATESFVYDQDPQALTVNSFTKTGYHLSRWNTEADGSGISYSESASVSNLTSLNGGTVNLYAIWEANTYTVRFNANGGTGEMEDENFIYDQDVKALTTNSFSKEGYRFIGWVLASDSRDIIYEDSETVSNIVSLGTITLYACWESEYYSITDEGILTLTEMGKDNLSGDIEIPAYVNGIKVNEISDNSFNGCTRITTIMIPDGVTTIGTKAFNGCTGLTSISIPDSVTSIGYQVFRSCTGLASIEIPDGVACISIFAFSGCTSLSSVTIPDSVTVIDQDAFINCTGLTSITIPNGVTSIGNECFRGCSGLTRIIIPDSLTSIGARAFFGCKKLTSITIPSGITSIKDECFSGCSGLTRITIPDSVTDIGICSFSSCSSLTSITIPDSVTNIGNSALSYCSNLGEINYSGTVIEWGLIEKGSDWANGLPNSCVVHCSDGSVNLD